MKKFLIFIIIFLAITVIGFSLKFLSLEQNIEIKIENKIKPIQVKRNIIEKSEKSLNQKFEVYINDVFVKSFKNSQEAIEFAKINKKSLVKEYGKVDYVWDNYPSFLVYLDEKKMFEFETFKEAIDFSKDKEKVFIYYRKNNNLIWTNVDTYEKKHIIQNVGLIEQLPELPRGCEVTSLAMLMKYKNKNISKIILADEIKKDNSEFLIQNKEIHYGNPNNGFVGDMYSLDNNGLGVYHKPIYELLSNYFPASALDITGVDFSCIEFFISKDIPVWVIINSTYDKLPMKNFQKWQTSDGEIMVTYFEHSVLVTGYDEENIYFSDPKNKVSSAKKQNFILAWEQMGRQAVTLTN